MGVLVVRLQEEPLTTPADPSSVFHALTVLREGIQQDRAGTWLQVASLIPDPGLRREIRRHVADLRLVARLRGRSRRSRRRPPVDRRTLGPGGMCRCGQPLPHPPRVPGLPPAQWAVWSKHFKYIRQVRASRIFWDSLSPAERQIFHRRCRAGFHRRNEQRWVDSLDPRLVKTLGRREALRHYILNHNARATASHQIKVSCHLPE